MWYPMGKPQAPGLFHQLKGAYGQNKICKQREHPGDAGGGWHRCVWDHRRLTDTRTRVRALAFTALHARHYMRTQGESERGVGRKGGKDAGTITRTHAHTSRQTFAEMLRWTWSASVPGEHARPSDTPTRSKARLERPSS